MIDLPAKDFRIGNVVNAHPSPEFKVTAWLLQHWATEKIEAVPLTSEWLERMGFENFKEHSKWAYKYKHFVNSNELMVIIDASNKQGGACYLNGTHFADCEYIHTFQNLYFALTGQELEIKELA